jgi:outer membrane protein
MKPAPYLAALLSLLGLTAQAQSVQTVPLKEAVELALQHNSSLHLSADRIALAEARLRQTQDRALPKAGASVQVSRLSILAPFELFMGGSSEPAFGLPVTSFWSTIGTLGVEKELFTGFAEKSAERSAELLVEASKLDVEKDQQEVEYNVAAAYYNIFKLIESRRILDNNLQLLTRKEKDVQNLLREGVLTSNELVKIQLQNSNLQLARVDLENARKTALYNLATLIGTPDAIAINTTVTLGSPVLDDVAVLQQQAEGSRLELKAGAIRRDVAETGIRQAKSAYLPRLSASGSYIYLNPNKNVLPDQHTYLQALNLGVSASYGISALYANKGRMQEARVNVLQAEHQIQVQRDQIRSEVYGQFNTYQSATEKIRVSEQGLALARRSFQLSDSKFRNGLLTSSDLLEAQNLQLQAELNLLNSRVDAQLAYYRLQKVTGNPIR